MKYHLRIFLTLILLFSAALLFQNCGKGFSSQAKSDGSTPLSVDSCPTAGLASTNQTINLQGDCEINGNVSLSGSSALLMTNGTLTIRGQLVLNDTSELRVTNGNLKFPQSNYSEYSVTLHQHSLFKLLNSSMITNATTQNNFSMSLDAYDNSTVNVENSNLNTGTGSWLLANFHDQSSLIMQASEDLPTEIYPSDASNISISAGSSFAGLWLEFGAGSNATINVPIKDSQQNYNFNFGPSTGIAYAISVAGSKGRLGLNSHPNSTLIVNGNGASGTHDVDLIFGYYFENNTAAVQVNGLSVGADITRQFTDQGRMLQLNHVNLNPFSWQVYAKESNGFPVIISNSFINEVTLFTNGRVSISNSVLQLAVTGAVGPGSILSISGTQIWSQSILAQNGGQVQISNSQLHGNFISATGAGSAIVLANVGEAKNGVSPQSCAAVAGYPPNNNGVPLCNPFNPLYQCSQLAPTSGGATIMANPSLSCPP